MSKNKHPTPAINNDSNQRLNVLASEIDRIHANASKVLLSAQLDIGKRLIEARTYFKGDREFGQWREANTPIRTASVALNLMKVAEAHAAGTLPKGGEEHMSWTALLTVSRLGADVALAVTERIEKAIGSGTKISARDVRTLAEKKAEEAVDADYEEVPEPTPAKATKRGQSFESTIQKFLSLPLAQRIHEIQVCATEDGSPWRGLSGLDKHSAALLVAGVPFDSGYAPSDAVITAIWSSATGVLSGAELEKHDMEYFSRTVWPLCMAHWRTLRESNEE